MNRTIQTSKRNPLRVLLSVAAALICASCALQADETEDVTTVNVGDVPLAIATSCNINSPGQDIWISPNGKNTNPGTFLQPKKTLQNVHDTLIASGPPNKRYVIHVDGGVYRGQTVEWSFLNPRTEAEDDERESDGVEPAISITIEACPDAVPIFDGRFDDVALDREAFFFRIEPTHDSYTYVTMRNLTIRNYHQHGVALNPVSGDFTSGKNTIEGCTFENIGSAHWPGEAQNVVSAINVARSSANTIRNNRFVAIEDEPTDSPQLHAIYCAYGSSDNIIQGNSFDRCSGDPIKFRDGSNNNELKENSFNRCGDGALINLIRNNSWICPETQAAFDESGDCNAACVAACVQVWEDYSTGNVASTNIVTFPHANAKFSGREVPELLKCKSEAGSAAGNCPSDHVRFDPDNFLVLSEPNEERIAAIVGGDFDDDGRDEILVAFNYDGQEGFSKIMSTAGSVDNRHLHKAIYANDRWNVNAMTSCDCDDDGDLELITALQFVDDVTWIYSGDGETHRQGLGSGFYSSSFWDVSAMAGGDYDGDGNDELITSFQSSIKSRIYAGDGVTSPTNIAMLMNDETAPYFQMTAQAAGNFGGSRDAIITAMNTVGATSADYKIYKGNGTSAVDNTTLHSDTTVPYWRTTATVAGDFDNDGTEELVTGMYAQSASYKLYRGNGTSNVNSETLLSSSSPFFIRALGAADYNSDDNLDLITAIETPGTSPALRILVGNGGTSYDNLGTLYSSTYMD